MSAVRVVEVGPRDGLQNIKNTVPTSIKTELIRRLRECGLGAIEATSFVSPKWIPQMADGAEVLDRIQDLVEKSNIEQKTYPVLVPNTRGLKVALKAGAKEVAVFISASEGFSRRNINCSVEESLNRAEEVVKAARKSNVRVRGYLSSIFACPFDGPTDPAAVLKHTARLLDMGCYEVSLGDTLGVGTARQVRQLLTIMLPTIPVTRLAGHFHDTYGQAISNVVAAYEMGVRVFDSSVAGLGGCPYAPGAKGNLATEDLVYLFEQMQIPTGIDLLRLALVGEWITQTIGIPNCSRAGEAILAKRAPQGTATKAEKARTQLQKQSRSWDLIEDAQTHTVSRSGPFLKITLARPKNGNALTATMISSLTRLVSNLTTDKTIHSIIISAQGKYFCTGMDLSAGGATATNSTKIKDDQFHGLKNLFAAIENSPQTTISEITGPCIGGGVGLAMSCDIRLALQTATFTLLETKLGMVPAIISRYLMREWGISRTREAMVTARPVTPAELFRGGVIHGVAPDLESLHNLLEEKLDQVSGCAPMASALCKALVAKGWMFPGGKEQEKEIREVYDYMMGPSQEAKYGLECFRRGERDVDWTKMGEKTSKL